MMALMKAPKSTVAPLKVTAMPLTSGLPPIMEMSGLMMLSVSEVTMAVKAPPMMTATARSMTLPLLMNSLNSLKSFFIVVPLVVGLKPPWPELVPF